MADEPERESRGEDPNRGDGPELWARGDRPNRGDDTEPTTRSENSTGGDGPELWAGGERPVRGDDTEPVTQGENPNRGDDTEPTKRMERSDRAAETERPNGHDEAEPRTRIEHPNRRKPASKVTRLLVVLLLLVSAALMIIVTLGGWSTLQGAKPVQIAYILVYLLLAFFVARWSRGVLPLIAALAIVLGIFAVVSVPGWYDRDQPGFTDPGLPSDVLGLVTALIVPVQLLLIAVSLSGFRQAWNVEIERRVDDDDRPREPRARRGGSGHSPAPA